MQAQLIFIKVKERLNKLDSSDYDNISCWQVREAFNKAQIEWVRRQLIGKNDTQEGDEETDVKVDDLQVLLKSVTISGRNYKLFFESGKIPTDYLYYKRVTPIVQKGECSGVRLTSVLREEQNVDEYLTDWAMQPSFDFEQSFHTLVNNRFRVYTNNDFNVENIDIIYYRLPRELDFQGCDRIDGIPAKNVDPEFKDDIVEILIDDTAAILAGDIESVNQVTINKQRSQINT